MWRVQTLIQHPEPQSGSHPAWTVSEHALFPPDLSTLDCIINTAGESSLCPKQTPQKPQGAGLAHRAMSWGC